MWAPTANTKYKVSIAVVSLANAGNRLTDSRPIAEAALTAGSTGRTFSGTPKVSRLLAMGGMGIAQATASPAWNAARAA
jgi:hypothetical protein